MNLNFRPIWRYEEQLIEGISITLLLTGVAVVVGLIIGILGALSLNSGHKYLRPFFRGYIEIIRNTPVLIQIFIIFFIFPRIGIQLEPIQAACVSLGIYFGAYAIEIIRSGLDSIPKSQSEAGLCLGIKKTQVLFYIIIPQAVRNIYPSMTSQFILLLLGTSIASQISTEELFHVAGFIDSRTYRSFEIYTLICIIYFSLVLMFKAFFYLLAHFIFQWPIKR